MKKKNKKICDVYLIAACFETKLTFQFNYIFVITYIFDDRSLAELSFFSNTQA